MIAFLGTVKKAAVRTHLIQQIIFHERQQTVLNPVQVTLAVQIINLWKNFPDDRIVFMVSIRQPDTPVVIYNIGKCQYAVFVGWKFFLKFPHPDLHSSIGTDPAEPVKKFQVFLCDFQGNINLYILFLFVKICFRNFVLSAHCTKCAENCGFSYVIFADQYQSILYITDFKIANVAEIFDMKFLNAHMSPSLLWNYYSCFSKKIPIR